MTTELVRKCSTIPAGGARGWTESTCVACGVQEAFQRWEWDYGRVTVAQHKSAQKCWEYKARVVVQQACRRAAQKRHRGRPGTKAAVYAAAGAAERATKDASQAKALKKTPEKKMEHLRKKIERFNRKYGIVRYSRGAEEEEEEEVRGHP
jgi:hypothetical protein